VNAGMGSGYVAQAVSRRKVNNNRVFICYTFIM
jgi:hypothetical protein